MCITRINLGLMMTAGLHSTSSRGPISGGLVIALELTGMSLSIERGRPMLYSVYAAAMRQFSVRTRDVLMNAQCPQKWWSNLKLAVFG